MNSHCKLSRGLLITLCCIILTGGLSHCSSSRENTWEEVLPAGFWVDNNTYRVRATGTAPANITSRVHHRVIAKQNAIADAQRTIIRSFMAPIEIYYSSVDDYCQLNELPPLVRGAIAGGEVITENYDEQENCAIMYEVTTPGLKKMVTPPIPCNQE